MKKFFLSFFLSLFLSFTSAAEILLINEIHPNPKGSDSGKEWLEIINLGSTNLNLENYQILLSDKTKYTFEKEILPPKSLRVIDLKSIKNSNEKITLKNPHNQTLDNIILEKSKNGLSFTRIGRQFLWTQPSKNQKNPEIQLHQGLLSDLIEKIQIPKNKNPKLLELVQTKQLQILSLDHQILKIRIQRE